MKTKGNLQVIAKHDRNASRTWKMLLRSDGTSSYSHGLWATEAQDQTIQAAWLQRNICCTAKQVDNFECLKDNMFNILNH